VCSPPEAGGRGASRSCRGSWWGSRAPRSSASTSSPCTPSTSLSPRPCTGVPPFPSPRTPPQYRQPPKEGQCGHLIGTRFWLESRWRVGCLQLLTGGCLFRVAAPFANKAKWPGDRDISLERKFDFRGRGIKGWKKILLLAIAEPCFGRKNWRRRNWLGINLTGTAWPPIGVSVYVTPSPQVRHHEEVRLCMHPAPHPCR